jgi:hypothetical protein
MTRTTNSKKLASRKILTTMSAVIVIASVVMTTAWQIPQAIANSLEEIWSAVKYLHLLIKFGTLFQMSTMRQNIGLHLKTLKISTR